jgi:hypothetical protein
MAVSGPQTGWSASISTGTDNLTAILGKINYGTIVEFPQGISCKVIETDSYWHTGYVLPVLPVQSGKSSIDDITHQWIIFRTATGPGPLPPPGFRTGPTYANSLAKLIVQRPGMFYNGTPNAAQNFNGQIFDCNQAQCHHFYFENLEFTHLADTSVYPPGIVDPYAFTDYIRLQPAVPTLSTTTTPDYNVVDRVYAHIQQWPSRQWCVFAMGGNHWAVENSYLLADMWRLGSLPGNRALANPSGNTMFVNKSSWGFTSGSPIATMTSTAAITFSNYPNGYSQYFYVYQASGTNNIGVSYISGPTVTCTNCVAVATNTLNVPYNTLNLMVGSAIQASTPSVTTVYDLGTGNPQTDGTTRFAPWKPLGIYVIEGNNAVIHNNFIQAPGQTMYSDTDGPHNDSIYDKNYFLFPNSKMANSGSWDGYIYTYRNVFELKQALRMALVGNIIDGAASYQNSGFAVDIAGSYTAYYGPGNISNGTQDLLIKDNIIKRVSSAFSCLGGGAQLPPDAPTANRMSIYNNLILAINEDIYSSNTYLFGGLLQITPGCTDINFSNNTVDSMAGSGPTIVNMGNASSGPSVMAEGFRFQNNIVHASLGGNLDLIWSSGGNSGGAISNLNNPSFAPYQGNTTISPWKTELDTFFIRTGTPTYSWGHNVMVGQQTSRGGGATELTQSQISVIMSTTSGNYYPPGDIWPNPVAGTLAARHAAINYDSTTYRVNTSTYNAGDVGANINEILTSAGIVTNIVPLISTTSVSITYTAPDTNSCAVDISSNGVSWTRQSDNTTTLNRSVTFGSLTPSTTYQYRVLCYFDQGDSWINAPNVNTTDGMIQTLAGATRSMAFAFNLANVSGATFYGASLTDANGQTYAGSASASPLTLNLPVGDYTGYFYYRSISTILAKGDTQAVRVR